MGIFAFLCIITLAALLIYYIMYPYPLVWYVKRQLDLSMKDAQNPFTVHNTEIIPLGNDTLPEAKAYAFLKADGSLPTSGNILIWIHGGAFIQATITGRPKIFDKLIENDVAVIMFDYPPGILKLEPVQKFINNQLLAIDGLLKTYSKDLSPKKVYWAGDSAGAFFAMQAITAQRKGDIGTFVYPPQDKVFGVSGFYASQLNIVYQWFWDYWVQRHDRQKIHNIKVPETVLPKLYIGKSDPLYKETLGFAKNNPQSHVNEYNGGHDFFMAEPTSVEAEAIIGDIYSEITAV